MLPRGNRLESEKVMTEKFKKQFSAIILAVFTIATFAACSKSDSKIVGSWKRTDKTEAVTEIFTADGDYIMKTPAASSKGKYELKGDTLRIFYPQAREGKDVNLKIVKLENDSMTVESDVDGRKMQAAFEKIGN